VTEERCPVCNRPNAVHAWTYSGEATGGSWSAEGRVPDELGGGWCYLAHVDPEAEGSTRSPDAEPWGPGGPPWTVRLATAILERLRAAWRAGPQPPLP